VILQSNCSRRTVMIGGMSVALLPYGVSAQTSDLLDDSLLPPLPTDLSPYSNDSAYRPANEASFVGAGRPTDEEKAQAIEIMRGAPKQTTPLAVAQYFLNLGSLKDDPRAPYAREWPIRANPLIQTFFTATDTIPYGDITPWCAAFINWCVARAHSARVDAGVSAEHKFNSQELQITTRSAASGSFRCWDATEVPTVGDLVVFKEPGSSQQCSGKGHVAFYLGTLPNTDLRILGGNQILKGTSGAVTISRYPRAGGEHGRLRLFGFRTSPALRDR
jgi:hypothetical protein